MVRSFRTFSWWTPWSYNLSGCRFFLSEDKLVEEVEEQYPDAFKLLIKEKKKNAVNVGIFDEDDEHLDDVEITSTKGVSKSLRKGKVIFVKTI